jgi:hypothetical protein
MGTPATDTTLPSSTTSPTPSSDSATSTPTSEEN